MIIQRRRSIFILRVAGQSRALCSKGDAVEGQIMKSRLFAIVVITSLFVHTHCWGDLNDKYKTRGWLNGLYWNYLSTSNGEEAKLTYILGIMDGINISNGFAKDDEELVKLNNTMEGLIPVKIKQSIDGAFNNESNVNIPIYIVMILEMRKMKGELSLSQYQKNLEEVRKTYAE
jgi:hypothetical protein